MTMQATGWPNRVTSRLRTPALEGEEHQIAEYMPLASQTSNIAEDCVVKRF
jgi:hypothetical protein